jgi:hypothetical protein
VEAGDFGVLLLLSLGDLVLLLSFAPRPRGALGVDWLSLIQGGQYHFLVTGTFFKGGSKQNV